LKSLPSIYGGLRQKPKQKKKQMVIKYGKKVKKVKLAQAQKTYIQEKTHFKWLNKYIYFFHF